MNAIPLEWIQSYLNETRKTGESKQGSARASWELRAEHILDLVRAFEEVNAVPVTVLCRCVYQFCQQCGTEHQE